MSNLIRVKILKVFPNPRTNRKTKEGDEIKVPKNQFWLRRLADKDCEEISKKSKAKKLEVSKADVKENKSFKGSK